MTDCQENRRWTLNISDLFHLARFISRRSDRPWLTVREMYSCNGYRAGGWTADPLLLVCR